MTRSRSISTREVCMAVWHSLRDKMGQVSGHVVTFVTRPSQSQAAWDFCSVNNQEHHNYRNIVATMKLE
eukprot:scaffold5011_cov143-Skeletonema_menzelii.AAC.17